MLPSMQAYSLDLRERIVRAVEGGQPRAAVARTFQISLSTVKRYAAQHRTTGSLAPKPQARQQPRITAAHQPALLAQLAAQPDATLAEHCQTWAQTQGVRVSVPTMWRAIARVGWTPKKSR
jgi:transposase